MSQLNSLHFSLTSSIRSRFFRACLLCLIAALGTALPGLSQDIEVLGPEGDRSVDQELTRALGQGAFRTLEGTTAAVRYTGALDRAHHVLQRLEVLGFYFDRWGEFPIPVAVYIMNRHEWEVAGIQSPYGLPLRTGMTAILAPSAGDDKTVLLWQELLGIDGLPKIGGQPIYGTKREAASLLASDTLLQIEATRGFVQRHRMVGREPWVADLMTHVVAGWVFEKHEAPRIAEIDDLYARLSSRYSEMGRVGTLSQYSPSLVRQGTEGIETWLWYQGQFRRGARIILGRGDKKTVPHLLKMVKKNGGIDTADLVKRYPGLADWMSAFPQQTDSR